MEPVHPADGFEYQEIRDTGGKLNVRGGDNLGVAVQKRNAQTRGKCPSDSGFSRSHHADHHDGFLQFAGHRNRGRLGRVLLNFTHRYVNDVILAKRPYISSTKEQNDEAAGATWAVY